jgi:WD40 repeat protein
MDPVMACRAAHRVDDVVFSPDRRTLAVSSASFGDTLELFDIETGARLWKHSARGCAFLAVTFSGDGQLLATGGNVHQATVLAAENGRVIRRNRLASDTQALTHASITPDGARLALATATVLRIHDITSGDQTLEIDLGASWCHGIQINPDGTLLATAADDGVHLWDATTGHAQHVLSTSTQVQALRFSRCGHMLIAAEKNHTVRGWDARTGVETSQLFPPADTKMLTLSPDGLLALAAARDGTLQSWDITTGHEWAWPVHIGWRNPTALSHDRQVVAVGTGREVKIWNTKPFEPKPHAVPPPDRCHWCSLENHPRG